jgi:hypothetical protein
MREASGVRADPPADRLPASSQADNHFQISCPFSREEIIVPKSRKHSKKTYKYVPTLTENPLLYDIPHLAGVLCCTIWATRSLIWGGQLHATKIGHKFLVSREELQRFVASQREQVA